MSGELDFSEFLDVFLQEAFEQLEKLDDGLLRMERDSGDDAILNEIFRAAHTLKGSSATMGFTHIKELTHDAENLLDALRPAPRAVRSTAVDSLLATTALLKEYVELLTQGDTEGLQFAAEADKVRKQLAQAMPGKGEAEAGPEDKSDDARPGIHIEIRFNVDCQMPAVRAFMATQTLERAGKIIWQSPDGEAFDAMQASQVFKVGLEKDDEANLDAIVNEVAKISEIDTCKITRQANHQDDATSAAELVAQQARKLSADASAEIQTVRVAVDRLDRLVNLIGELVVDRTGLSLIETALADKYGTDVSVQNLGGIANHLGRVVGDLHDEIMKMRMLPVGQVFKRFPRMVRDVAQKLGKKVDLVLEGEGTGLDRSILEDIVDPLTHILRNSIDHGVEMPSERIAAGKDPVGKIVLSARHEEGNVVIEVEDDGKGVDTGKLKNAAVNRGSLSEEAAAKMDDREALMLLFQSGVSTAENVTEISGRGVGMDVVKNNIEHLHGQVEVHSQIGKGTRMTVRLPLTLAIVEALIIRTGDRLYAVPLNSVVSAVLQTVESIHRVNGVPCVVIRGETLPLVSMSFVFDGVDSPDYQSDKLVIIVQSRGQQVALAVDELIGKMDIVVKTLGAFLGELPGLSGAAILGDGHIALIADIASLLELVRKNRATVAA